MPFAPAPLPYDYKALAPHLSEEALHFHYDKHHTGYATKLNSLTEGKPEASLSLGEIVASATGAIYNCAAQIINHDFYWQCLSPSGGGEPKGKLAEAIVRDFGSFAKFKEDFTAAAAGHFGSGWAWLVQTPDKKLAITQTHDAGTPTKEKPILTCDVWEHAYYIDYRNDRAKYIAAWWNLVNWDFAESQLL